MPRYPKNHSTLTPEQVRAYDAYLLALDNLAPFYTWLADADEYETSSGNVRQRLKRETPEDDPMFRYFNAKPSKRLEMRQGRETLAVRAMAKLTEARRAAELCEVITRGQRSGEFDGVKRARTLENAYQGQYHRKHECLPPTSL